jgi:hypothetical protein
MKSCNVLRQIARDVIPVPGSETQVNTRYGAKKLLSNAEIISRCGGIRDT